MGALARSLPAASPVLDYASRIVIALQPRAGARELVRDYVRLGPSPRGAQALTLAGSVAALLAGRNHLAYEDIRAVALPALRHRLILTFDAERNGVTADDIVAAVVARRARRRDVSSGDGPLLDARAAAPARASAALDAERRSSAASSASARAARASRASSSPTTGPTSPGDELRRIDWNIYRRLRQLVVKVGVEDGRLSLALLVDTSRSMRVGEPSKMRAAQRMAAALAAIALLRGDQAEVHSLGDGRSRPLARLDGPRQITRARARARARCPSRSAPVSRPRSPTTRAAGTTSDVAMLISDAQVPPEELGPALRTLALVRPHRLPGPRRRGGRAGDGAARAGRAA